MSEAAPKPPTALMLLAVASDARQPLDVRAEALDRLIRAGVLDALGQLVCDRLARAGEHRNENDKPGGVKRG